MDDKLLRSSSLDVDLGADIARRVYKSIEKGTMWNHDETVKRSGTTEAMSRGLVCDLLEPAKSNRHRAGNL
jgi:hypothetical protein